ncbi:hypothetical protein [uncultured Fibrobacter sp.]|uniref:hypothetical protein n=1 Tax=uncultured Fibrobacter sp. TaxID=261512 RepID=UPI002603A991|nr:hypothetical protein [uncultured Fibrobacter sp.]
MFRRLVVALERVGGVGASLFTWEVSVPFNDEPGEARLREEFAREFPESSGRGRPCFWKMVAFNGDSGRKVRYLVAVAAAPVDGMRRKFDRVLPEGIALYGMADRIIRSSDATHGNALFSFLCGSRLVLLVLCEGRLCHWSEEEGYEDGFGGRAYAERMERFRQFLARDEYLARGCPYSEFRERVDPATMQGEFRRAARDPFWRGLDLDNAPRVRPLARRAALAFLIVAVISCTLGSFAALFCNGPFAEGYDQNEPYDIALADPPALVPAADEVRDTLYRARLHKISRFHRGPHYKSDFKAKCAAPPLKLRSVVQGVLFQGDVGGMLGWYRPGDSVGAFIVDSVGRDGVFLKCGGKRVVVSHEE